MLPCRHWLCADAPLAASRAVILQGWRRLARAVLLWCLAVSRRHPNKRWACRGCLLLYMQCSLAPAVSVKPALAVCLIGFDCWPPGRHIAVVFRFCVALPFLLSPQALHRCRSCRRRPARPSLWVLHEGCGSSTAATLFRRAGVLAVQFCCLGCQSQRAGCVIEVLNLYTSFCTAFPASWTMMPSTTSPLVLRREWSSSLCCQHLGGPLTLWGWASLSGTHAGMSTTI